MEKGLNFLPLLRQIISSDFDVDRMDYLYRDSLHCGVKYGLIDFVWIIFHFDCHIVNNQVFLAIEREALYTLESLILGRQQMRLIVYFHHKSAIYNHMLKKYAEDSHWRLPASIKDYARFTDDSLFEQLKSEKNPWAKRIIKKTPYLRLYERSFLKSSSEREKKPLFRLKQRLREKNMDFIEISSEHSPLPPSSGKRVFKTIPCLSKKQSPQPERGAL